jgi:hypothetical protein
MKESIMINLIPLTGLYNCDPIQLRPLRHSVFQIKGILNSFARLTSIRLLPDYSFSRVALLIYSNNNKVMTDVCETSIRQQLTSRTR